MAFAGYASGRGLTETNPLRAQLLAAYHATTYRIIDRAGNALDTRIGRTDPAVDALLPGHAAGRAIFVTAHNPQSQRLSHANNTARHTRLAYWLGYFDARCLHAIALPDSNDWPPEPGFFVIGPGHALGRRIASLARQAAWVSYTVGEAPRLHWT